MDKILYIIVLMFEILYYTLFIKFSTKNGSFWKYILLFTTITLIGIIIGTNNLFSYLILILMILFGLKYVVKLKVGLYDMLIIFMMLIVKIIIETPTFLLFNNLFNIYVIGIIYSFIKIAVVLTLKNKLNFIYKFLKIKWDNNNFYIRYIFTILMFVYTITSCIFIIFYYM